MDANHETFFELFKNFQNTDDQSCIEDIKMMLDQNFSFDEFKGPKSRTLLHYFALETKTYNYDLLFKSFVRYNHTDDDKNTAFHLCQNPQFFRELLSRGVSFSIKNNEQNTPIDMLIINDRDDLLSEFNNMMPKFVIEHISMFINTCIKYGSYKCFQFLANERKAYFITHFLSTPENLTPVITSGNKFMINTIFKIAKVPINNIPWNNSNPSRPMISSLLSQFTLQEVEQLDLKSLPDFANKDYLLKILEQHKYWQELPKTVIQTPIHMYSALNQDQMIGKLRLNDVDMLNNEGQTPLFVALIYGATRAAKILLLNRANCNKICNGSTPMHEAAKRNMTQILELMLQTKKNYNIFDKNGLTPLFCAVESKSEDCANFLLNANARVDLQTKTGDNILHFAAKNDCSPELLKKLIEKGAPLYVKNNKGEIPLITALKNYYKSVHIILDEMKGNLGEFNINLYSSQEIWNNSVFYEYIKNYPQESMNDILRLAVKHCHVQGFSAGILSLMENISESRKAELLKISIYNNNNVTCSFLAGIYPNLLVYKSKKGDTVMHWIARCNPSCSDAIFRSCYRNIDQVFQTNNNNESPFHVAVEARNFQFLNTFLKEDSENKYSVAVSNAIQQIKEAFDTRNKDNLTPLELALSRRDFEISQLITSVYPHPIFSRNITTKLLQRVFFTGIDGSIYNQNNLSLISHAILTAENESVCYDCVKLIVEQGGDPNMKDKDGKLPANYAVEKKYTSVVEYLLYNGGILSDVNGFLNSVDKTMLSDEIMENIHRHDVRANSIMELFENEKSFLEKMKLLSSSEIIQKLQVVLFSLSNIINISERLVDSFEVSCHRLSPSSCIAKGLKITGKFANCYHAFLMMVNEYMSNAEESVKNSLQARPHEDSLSYQELLDCPAQHIREMVILIERITRATPEKHQDFDEIFSAYKLWKDIERRCNHEELVYKSFMDAKSKRVTFMPTVAESYTVYPTGSIILWQGDVIAKKVFTNDQQIKKAFHSQKDPIHVFIFNSIFWFSQVVKQKHSVFFVSPISNLFIEKIENGLLITGNNISLELNFVDKANNGIDAALFELEKGFAFPTCEQRLVKCIYILEETGAIEQSLVLLNCDTKETAIAEFKNLNKEKIKKYSNGNTEMINIVPVGKERHYTYCRN